MTAASISASISARIASVGSLSLAIAAPPQARPSFPWPARLPRTVALGNRGSRSMSASAAYRNGFSRAPCSRLAFVTLRGTGVTLAVILAACSTTATPTPAPLSDAAMQAVITSNIETSPNSLGGGIGRKRDGTLDITVRDRVLYVATAGIGTPDRLCGLVVAVTKDSQTSQPLGVTKVVIVGSAAEQLAECRP